MNQLLSITLVLSVVISSYGQENFWQEESISTKQTVNIKAPKTKIYIEYELDIKSLAESLQSVKERGEKTSSSHILQFPTSQRKLESFRIIEASIMHPDLAKKYPR